MELWPRLMLAALILAAPARTRAEDGDSLRILASWMCGSFSSAAQAKKDADYLDIRLRMARIWPHLDHGYWLYVEQAVAWSQNEPYRQRVYHLTHVGGDLYQSEVFELPGPSRFVGAWRNPSLLDALSPDSLEARVGCAVVLRKWGDSFVGSTLGRLCPTTLRGAAFATTEVEVRQRSILTWERGFASEGAQVWGATKGPYVFDKIETFSLE